MTYKKALSWAAVLLWMAVIFSLSSQIGEQSDQLSVGITKTIVQVMGKAVPKTLYLDIDSLNRVIRKNAHFFAYLILGLLMINAIRNSGIYGKQSILIALSICVIYAISDEIHQLFVPGRSGLVKDVIIDTAGAAVGAGVYMAVGRILWNRKNGSKDF